MSNGAIGPLVQLLDHLGLDGDTESLSDTGSPPGIESSPEDAFLAIYEEANQVISGFRNNYPSKTLGICIPGSGAQGPMRAAVSGWRSWPYDLRPYDLIDQGDTWRVVRELSRLIGHPTLSSPEDQGILGRYLFCHAEKQIIADSFWNNPDHVVNTIAVSREPCEDCCDFLARVELVHGLRFEVNLDGRNWTEGRELSFHRVWLTSLADLCH